MKKQTIEDYLKTLYLLDNPSGLVTTTQLANARSVAPSSATSMMQRLAQNGLVTYEKQYGVELTEAGKVIALQTLRRHRLLELFLVKAMDYDWGEVHIEAEKLEHVVSDEFIERITRMLGDPQFDPYGEPIPALDGTITAIPSQPINTLAIGETAVICRITDDTNCELLRYLAELGLVPGTNIQVLAVAPFEGPLTLKINQEEKIVGHHVASMVHVARN